MAETRLYDCPNCGRENVIGYHSEDNFTKGAKLVITGCTAIAGALIAGPLGFMAGLEEANWEATNCQIWMNVVNINLDVHDVVMSLLVGLTTKKKEGWK